jgi:hypothetical protein
MGRLLSICICRRTAAITHPVLRTCHSAFGPQQTLETYPCAGPNQPPCQPLRKQPPSSVISVNDLARPSVL